MQTMGGVIDEGGVGFDTKTSPRRLAIEKAQAQLRQEYDVREQRRRELEYLENGGNPLDFKLGRATSISAQSTSVTDQFVTCEAKGSFALAASPHGDSIESSGRLGVVPGRESNSADNLLLFDGENEWERNSTSRRSRSDITPSPVLDACRNEKGLEDSEHFVVKSQAYARRNRSKSSRDSARVGDGNGSSKLPSTRHGSRYTKGLVHEASTLKNSSICNSTSQNGNLALETLAPGNQLDRDLDDPFCKTATSLKILGFSENSSDLVPSKDSWGNVHNQHLHVSAGKVPNTTECVKSDVVRRRDNGVSSDLDCMARASADNVGQPNSLNIFNTDGPKEDQVISPAFSRKCLESDSSYTPISATLDGNTSTDQHLNSKKIVSQENSEKQTSVSEDNPETATIDIVKGECEAKAVEVLAIGNHDDSSLCLNPTGRASCVKSEERYDSTSAFQNELQPCINLEEIKHTSSIDLKKEKNVENLSADNIHLKKTSLCSLDRLPSIKDPSRSELPKGDCSETNLVTLVELQSRKGTHLKLPNKAHEDSVLEEARSIEAKHKRIAELSVGSYPLKSGRKSHWDFVLEEMAWLANDFMQERVWKITAAAQICQSAAINGRLKSNICREQKIIAHTVAKAVLQFWLSAEALLSSCDSGIAGENYKSALIGALKVNNDKDVEGATKHQEEPEDGNTPTLAVQEYAVRFLKYSSSLGCPVRAEAPLTPERIFDSGIVDMSWEYHFTEEALFYTVPPGAMDSYRKSIEFYWSQYEKIGSNMHKEEVETSTYDAVEGRTCSFASCLIFTAQAIYCPDKIYGISDFGSRDNAYEDYERQGTYPRTFKGSNPSKFSQKNRKKLPKSYGARSCEPGIVMENRLMGKRPLNLSGSIPTKRIRTAISQRVASPFSSGVIGGVHLLCKTDVSSGDTSSFQDDLSSVHGGSQTRKAAEIESTGEFRKQLPFDYTDVSMKPKKKKKSKHLVYTNSTDTECFVVGKGSAYEQRWQLDSVVQNEQRDLLKRRSESRAFESNGNSVASQMSNMSNPNKFMKLMAGRDRGRKTKTLKMATRQFGPGNPWSQFEDQALVVLVHDMGQNWELISDAINSTMQFKCIFRKPKECKERHKILMDGNAGDGADSAEDSGSSQPHTSGRATKLFYRLHEPMEEDTVKSHFEKIILLGQKQHSRRAQNGDQEQKQFTPIHNSHVNALSQVCLNNLNGVALTPHDLFDATTLSSDGISLGYQGSQSNGLTIPDQSSMAPALPTSGANSILQGSSGMGLGNSFTSPSTALSAPTRDGHRYGLSRPPSLPTEQQKMQQYNNMLSGRNIPHSSFSAPGPDRAANGSMGIINRGSMPMPRPGFQGIGSPAALNLVSSGSMISTSGVGIPSSNVRSGAVPVQGTSTMRTRESLHMIRPSVQNPEDQRQVTLQELQMQGNGQGGTPSFNTGFSNPSIQTYPPQQHQMNPHTNSHLQGTTTHQQAYVNRLAKERQLQQRFLQHHHQQNHFSPANNLMPRAQSQSISSSSMQNSSQIHHQQPVLLPSSNSHLSLSSSSSPMNPISSQPQQKHHLSQLHQGFGRNPLSQAAASPGSLQNQMLRQRQRQQQQQQQHQQLQQPQHRNHPQHRQQSPSQSQQQQQQQQQQLQGKLMMKGVGRGNIIMHPTDPSSRTTPGICTTTPAGNQVAVEKGEQVATHSIEGEGSSSATGSSHAQPLVPSEPSNQCPPQQKLFHGDCSNTNAQVQVPSSGYNNTNFNFSPVLAAKADGPNGKQNASSELQNQL
ncbi:hypothetical protein GIB67_015940 [Kingdonia uniflora]|uniref:Chromatin modification-related protein EAF1 B-like n=1 Tax=Kingdonia uniflora TaxID=39325 RepID=A0A7J7PC87_9MAGN|nr:hypothetical protein GIB67_015940 [Kingdonia uniflora]